MTEMSTLDGMSLSEWIGDIIAGWGYGISVDITSFPPTYCGIIGKHAHTGGSIWETEQVRNNVVVVVVIVIMDK
jgi:hypothetical protein